MFTLIPYFIMILSPHFFKEGAISLIISQNKGESNAHMRKRKSASSKLLVQVFTIFPLSFKIHITN